MYNCSAAATRGKRIVPDTNVGHSSVSSYFFSCNSKGNDEKEQFQTPTAHAGVHEVFFPSPAAAELEDTGSPCTESVKRVDYATGRESSRFNQ